MKSQRRLVSPLSAVNLSPNTFIGGVASEIPTKADLASKLVIAESSISYFGINGNDIEAKIDVDYQIPISGFYSNLNITKYLDTEGKITELKRNCFDRCDNMKSFYSNADLILGNYVFRKLNSNAAKMTINIPNTTNIAGFSFNGTIAEYINIRNVLTIHSTTGADNVFGSLKGNPKIYAHTSLETANGGAIEGDLLNAQNLGATLVFVINETSPNAITNLSIGTKYATALQINLTPPSSVNAIDFYEVYVDGVYKNDISASGGFIAGLNIDTTYTITVKAVDVYYNKSEFSNSVNDKTSATYVIPTANISNYYRFNDDLTDSVGTNNGTGTAINYAAGKSGNAASFNGTTSNISFTQMLQAIPSQSISCFVKSNENSRQQRILALSNGVGTPYFILRIGTTLNLIECNIYDGSAQLYTQTNVYDITQWNHIVVTMVENNNWKMYVNGALVATRVLGSYVVIAGGNYFGSDRNGGTTVSLNGQIDGVATWNKELSQAEILEIYSKQNAGEELI